MNGKKSVIDFLNSQLTLELTSMDQYLAHAKIYDDLGLSKLHEKLLHEHEEELAHSKQLIERIIFLGGEPDTISREKVNISTKPVEMLQNDLDGEYLVAENLRKGISLCEKENDYVSRNILVELLNDTETDHIFWLQQHLRLIDKIGIENYLQSQL
ncbi:bacterioferritin [Paraphotobacterium marinum]|uniref:Bacterioferritin n=1 Tax=Paraphotobacterium marinum TaxID=1755811 RepID=A0A220VE24_9GAMM|nr:bacterioferritin [Paraphotobacterium marinum]ASK78599.1 bacterioferritin [Paraphotobacterium marinum]